MKKREPSLIHKKYGRKSFMKILISVLCLLLICVMLSACSDLKIIKHFEDWCKTTSDGFEYYYNEGSKDGVYILKIPDVEELAIPEYIDGKRVVELGHEDMGIGYKNDYIVTGNNTKKLIVQHQFSVRNDAGISFYANFPNLTNLIFIDFLYCNISTTMNELIVPYYIGNYNYDKPNVELRKSERNFSLENFRPKIIIVPEYVKVIEKDVFAGLAGVTIKTSYKTMPEGWQEGWNGNCTVEWGIELNNKMEVVL